MPTKPIKQLLEALNEDQEKEIFVFLQQRMDERHYKRQIYGLLQSDDMNSVRSGLALLDTLGNETKEYLLLPFQIIKNNLMLPHILQNSPHAGFIQMWWLADICGQSTSQADLRKRLGLLENTEPIALRFPNIDSLPANIDAIFRWTYCQDGNICWSIQNVHNTMPRGTTLPYQRLFLRKYLQFIDNGINLRGWMLPNANFHARTPRDFTFDFSKWKGVQRLALECSDPPTILSLPNTLQLLTLKTSLSYEEIAPRLSSYQAPTGLPIVNTICEVTFRPNRERASIYDKLQTFVDHWSAQQNKNRDNITRLFAMGLQTLPADLHTLPNLQELHLGYSQIKHLPAFSQPLKKLYVMGAKIISPPQNVEKLYLDFEQYQRWKTTLYTDDSIKELHVCTDAHRFTYEMELECPKPLFLYTSQNQQMELINISTNQRRYWLIRRAVHRSFGRRIHLPRTAANPNERADYQLSIDLQQQRVRESCIKLYLLGVDMWVNPEPNTQRQLF